VVAAEVAEVAAEVAAGAVVVAGAEVVEVVEVVERGEDSATEGALNKRCQLAAQEPRCRIYDVVGR
jgi:hypothetical protein